MHEQEVLVTGDELPGEEPLHAVGTKALLVGNQAAIEPPAAFEGAGREPLGGDSRVAEELHAEGQHFVVPEQGRDRAAGLLAEPAHQVDDCHPVGATVDVVAEEPQARIPSCPVPIRVNQASPNERVVVTMHVTHRVDRGPWLCHRRRK